MSLVNKNSSFIIFILILITKGIPRAKVEKLHQEFVATTGKDNRMDKKEFRRLYKELYTSGHTGTSVPAVISEHDLEKISDRVFKSFDADGSGKNSFKILFIFIFISFSRQIIFRR
jgi:hypothetical protein